MKFKASIGRSTAIPQTQKVGTTLFETHSTHKVTEEYRALAKEIVEGLRQIETSSVHGVAAEKEVVNG